LKGAEANEPNFSKTLVKSKEEYGLSQDDIGEMTANLIGGGLDTSSSTLHSCILALCAFKDCQRKAQEEIDRVIGHDRTPDWADLDRLPYCNAIFKETLRWRSVTTLGGFAHAPTRDDYYRGFFFPAGIHVFGNLWAIHRDPKDFPDPDVFRPERYLEGNRLPYPNKQGHNAFGWGRRSCSGQPFAEQGLPMSIVRLLWSFHIQPGLDERVSQLSVIRTTRESERSNIYQGEEVKLDIFAYTDNENTRPRPFPARFTPRSETIKQLLIKDAEAARERLRKYDGETSVTVEQFASQ
jgi:cytochrome P450